MITLHDLSIFENRKAMRGGGAIKVLLLPPLKLLYHSSQYHMCIPLGVLHMFQLYIYFFNSRFRPSYSDFKIKSGEKYFFFLLSKMDLQIHQKDAVF